MDGFSVLFEIFLIAVFLTSWKSYFFPRESLRRYRTEAVIGCSLMAACASGVLFVLLRWSANDVREDSGETAFYLAATLFSMVAAQMLPALLGVSLRDDAMERGNRGALFTVLGLTIGPSCAREIQSPTVEIPALKTAATRRPRRDKPAATFSRGGRRRLLRRAVAKARRMRVIAR